jgi:hypothetical protein
MATVEGYYSHPHVRAQLFPSYEDAKRAEAGLGGLGDEESLKRMFASASGGGSTYGDLVNLIQVQAQLIAKNEIHAATRPLMFAAALLGVGSFLLGLALNLRK